MRRAASNPFWIGSNLEQNDIRIERAGDFDGDRAVSASAMVPQRVFTIR
jgi:hypothetical protein